MIDEQTDNSTESGGLIISMDTTAPDYAYGPNYSDTQEWMLAAMSGFFAFMACVGCLLVCIQAGYIPADSRFVAFGGGNDRPVVTEEQVNKLPVVEYSLEEHTDTACAICIDEYELGEKLRQLPCGHIFHQDCIIPWLTERHASCPLCKYDISQSEEEEEQNSSGTLWFARSYGSLARILPWNHGDRQLLNQEDEDTIVIIEEGSPEPPR